MQTLRSLVVAGAALAVAAAVAQTQEPPAKARNGGYLGIFVREPAPGRVVIATTNGDRLWAKVRQNRHRSVENCLPEHILEKE